MQLDYQQLESRSHDSRKRSCWGASPIFQWGLWDMGGAFDVYGINGHTACREGGRPTVRYPGCHQMHSIPGTAQEAVIGSFLGSYDSLPVLLAVMI